MSVASFLKNAIALGVARFFRDASGNVTGLVGQIKNDGTDFVIQASDFATIEAAINYANQFTYTNGSRPVIQLSALHSTISSVVPIPFGLLFKGTKLLKAMSGVVGTPSGAGGNWTVILQLDSVTEITAGMIVGIGGDYVPHGGTNPLLLCGAFEVLSVDATNHRITINVHSAYTVAPPSGAITSTFIYVFKNCLNFSGIASVLGQGQAVEVTSLALLITDSNDGINIHNGSSIKLDHVENLPVAVYSSDYSFTTSMVVWAQGIARMDACFFGNVIISADYLAAVHIDYASVGNTVSDGATAAVMCGEGSMVSAWSAIIVGADYGVHAYQNASISLDNAFVEYCGVGINAKNGAQVDAYRVTYAHNTVDRSPATLNTAGNYGALITDNFASAIP